VLDIVLLKCGFFSALLATDFIPYCLLWWTASGTSWSLVHYTCEY